MAASAFAFFRGGAAIMAADLAGTPTSGLRAQLCGDAHLLNFGMFETPERSLVFGLNDFDETLPGPIEWDIARLAVSVEIAGRDLGFEATERECAVLATVKAYREAMLAFAEQRNIEVLYACLPAEELRRRLVGMADRRTDHAVTKSIEKALRHDHLTAFDKLIECEDGDVRFTSDPPVLVPVEELLDGDERVGTSGSSPRSSSSTARASAPTYGRSSSRTGSCTWPERSSASAAWAPEHGSCCSRAATPVIRCCSS